jgi:hypothetical protein
MARSGLRMMPTFPSTPLTKIPYCRFSLGTAPKLAFQTGPSLIMRRLSLLPAYPSHRSSLPPSFVLSAAAWVLRGANVGS